MFLSFPKSEYYQWDTGQAAMLLSSAVDLTPSMDITEVHLWNDRIGGLAMVQPVCQGEAGRYVEIPDVLFQREGRIFCWAVVSDGAGASTITDYDEIVVIARAKPTNYAPGRVETLYYRSLLAELSLLKEAWQKAHEEDLPDLLDAIEQLRSAAQAGEFDGLSAYEVAVAAGFDGTQAEWLASLKGDPGADGFSPIVTVVPGTDADLLKIVDQEGEKQCAVPKSAESIVFTRDVFTAYPVGNIALKNGIGVMARAGESVADLFRNVWFKVMEPTVTHPSISVSFSAAAAEVGTTIHPAYYATFSAGSYSFGPATGVLATAWRCSDTEGNTWEDSMGTADILLGDETEYRLTVECDHTEGSVPYTNEGKEADSGQIPAGTLTWTSPVVRGYRNTFYGALTAADMTSWEKYIADGTLTVSDCIRTLSKSGKALTNGSSITVTIPAGTKQVVIAYPATLRDVTSIKDTNGMNAEIKSSFELMTIDVEGKQGYTAIPYKVYVLEYAEAVANANTYTVVI